MKTIIKLFAYALIILLFTGFAPKHPPELTLMYEEENVKIFYTRNTLKDIHRIKSKPFERFHKNKEINKLEHLDALLFYQEWEYNLR